MAELPSHPNGEQKTRKEIDLNNPIPVDTFGGRVHVKWDNEAAVTPFGQLAFFIEFLKTSGVYNDWVNKCPMTFSSPNAPSKINVLGTTFLSILAGHNRYSHMTSIRCDTVSTNLLGMSKAVSEDAVRRAFSNNIEEQDGIEWLKESFLQTY